MLLVQLRAAPQPLKSVQKPEPEPERFLSARVRGAAPFLLHISLISSLMDCPGPGSVSGELHSARLWFIPGGMSRLPPPSRLSLRLVLSPALPEATKQQVLRLAA